MRRRIRDEPVPPWEVAGPDVTAGFEELVERQDRIDAERWAQEERILTRIRRLEGYFISVSIAIILGLVTTFVTILVKRMIG